MQPPYLTDAEIADICRPLTQGAAQIRLLQRMGLIVKRRPDGTPLVGRAHYEAFMGGPAKQAERPDAGINWTVHPDLPQHSIPVIHKRRK